MELHAGEFVPSAVGCVIIDVVFRALRHAVACQTAAIALAEHAVGADVDEAAGGNTENAVFNTLNDIADVLTAALGEGIRAL